MAVEIKPGIFWIGVNDRTTDLFEGLWPIQNEGVSYNAYLVCDEKKAVIDLAKSLKSDEFFDQLAETVPIGEIDYLVVNHMEPDHTGIIKTLLRINDKIVILCTEKAKTMLNSFYCVTDRVKAVADGETVSLGGKSLQFFHAPFVHWPETMVTYVPSDKVLFTCDAFGGYGALRGGIFDDQCADPDFYESESLRYYVNIVARFSGPVLKAIEKLAGLDIAVIAPSHGLVWRKNPGRIVSLYQKWAGYASGKTEPGITLVWGSMYGNTEKAMNAAAQGVSSTGVPFSIFDAARTHVSYILPSLWTRSGVLIGAPTYEGGLFPPVAQALEMAVEKKVQNKKAAAFGSFAWSGGGMQKIRKIVEPVKWDLVDELTWTGCPSAADLKNVEAFAKRFAESIKAG
jgi:anaerobic nitric oxide reductase flavorubredoxin